MLAFLLCVDSALSVLVHVVSIFLPSSFCKPCSWEPLKHSQTLPSHLQVWAGKPTLPPSPLSITNWLKEWAQGPDSVTEPVCPMFQKAKTQNIRVSSMEMFIDREGPNRDDGRITGTSNPSKESTEFWLLLCQGEGK